jgi:hypothetical protein
MPLRTALPVCEVPRLNRFLDFGGNLIDANLKASGDIPREAFAQCLFEPLAYQLRDVGRHHLSALREHGADHVILSVPAGEIGLSDT